MKSHTHPAWTPLACLGAVLLAPLSASALAEAGPGVLVLSLEGKLEYDSNILSNNSEVSDTILRLSPRLEYGVERSLLHLNAHAGFSHNEFLDNGAQSDQDYMAGFQLSGLHRDPAPAMNFTLSGNWADRKSSSAEIGSLIEITSTNVDARLDYDFSEKTALRFGYGLGNQDYADVSYNDSRDNKYRSDFLYKYSEKLNYLGGYRYRKLDHSGVGLDYDTDTFIIGAEGELTPKISGTIETGASSSSYAGGDTLYYAVGLDWAVDKKLSVGLSGERDNTASASGVAAASTNLQLDLSQKVTDWITGNGFVSIGNFERFGDDGRTDDIFRTGISGALRMKNDATVNVSASFENRRSSLPSSDYQRFILSASGSFKF
jgi:hypothetical protein